MGRFGDDGKVFFSAVYQSEVPWEIGDIQPELKALLTAYPPHGKVLDVGCGSGDTAIAVGRLAYEVLGIDFVETAIEKAHEKLRSLENPEALNIKFICGNGLRPSYCGKDFGAIIDSGFMHLFDEKELQGYFADIYDALDVGGRIYLIEISHEFEIPNAPRAINKEMLQEAFRPERWKFLALKDGFFANKVSPVPATIACIEKLP